jgi:hypothetical protein
MIGSSLLIQSTSLLLVPCFPAWKHAFYLECSLPSMPCFVVQWQGLYHLFYLYYFCVISVIQNVYMNLIHL